MKRLMQSLGAGLVGSLLFYIGSLLFGGNYDSAYEASFWGFWGFAIAAFFIGGQRGKV